MTDREIVLLVGVICCILALCLFGVGMGIYQELCRSNAIGGYGNYGFMGTPEQRGMYDTSMGCLTVSIILGAGGLIMVYVGFQQPKPKERDKGCHK